MQYNNYFYIIIIFKIIFPSEVSKNCKEMQSKFSSVET